MGRRITRRRARLGRKVSRPRRRRARSLHSSWPVGREGYFHAAWGRNKRPMTFHVKRATYGWMVSLVSKKNRANMLPVSIGGYNGPSFAEVKKRTRDFVYGMYSKSN